MNKSFLGFRGLSAVALMTLLSSSGAFAQVESQVAIPQLEKIREDANVLVDNFEIRGIDSLEISTRDYQLANEYLKRTLAEKPKQLEEYLEKIRDNLKDDYSLIKSLRKLPSSKAIDATLSEATKRYIANIKDWGSSYKRQISHYIYGDLEATYNLCVSYLCVQLVDEDVKKITKALRSVNQDLDLGEATISKASARDFKDYLKRLEDKSKAGSEKSALTLQPNQEVNQHLEEATLDDVLKYGVNEISKYGLSGAKLRVEKREARRAKFTSKYLMSRIITDHITFYKIGDCGLDLWYRDNQEYFNRSWSVVIDHPGKTALGPYGFEYVSSTRASSSDNNEELVLYRVKSLLIDGVCGEDI